MTTEDILDILSATAKLMELHEANSFKVKALSNAAFRISKTRPDFQGKTQVELEKMEGIGKGIASKIIELFETGTTKEYEEFRSKTPEGVIEMLAIKGIGPKKVGQLWRELHVESIGELLYACNENRLIDLKGFGQKTQDAVKKSIEFALSNQHKKHYASVEKEANQFIENVKKVAKTEYISLTGAIYRKAEVLESIDIIGTPSLSEIESVDSSQLGLPINYIQTNEKDYFNDLVKSSATPKHLEWLNFPSLLDNNKSEKDVYLNLKKSFIEPELREGLFEEEILHNKKQITLIEYSDLKGTLHNHSKYSDGLDTLKQMAVSAKEMGLQYLGICDHSQSATYANGLKIDSVLEQQLEIDELNKQLAPFKIFKGIESDILNDGSLDYSTEILKTFDFIVASVHSNLKMNEEKSTERLIKAIENPYTTILGHPTGRLLLARPGYPIHHKKIIDACAANNVIIELNAHPYRLDIDWRWIPYCLEKGVKISINPDAHAKEGYLDMYYGVCSARKGLLTKEMCLNAMGLEEINTYFTTRKPK
jgi:DNA polymerase (family 10)